MGVSRKLALFSAALLCSASMATADDAAWELKTMVTYKF